MRDIKCATSLLVIAFACVFSVPAHTQTFDDIHRCDNLAAHPDDPNRWAEGVYDEKIIPGPARKFCGDAAKAYPDSARFHFQYGRALWAAKQYEPAVQAFLQAEKKEYGAAYAYLGDAHFHGLGGLKKDEDFAVTLYKMAAEAGFTPAETVLEQIANLQKSPPESTSQEASGGGTPIDANHGSQSAASNLPPVMRKAIEAQKRAVPAKTSEFDPTPFARGRRLQRLYNGDFESLGKQDQHFLMIYLLGLNDGFSKDYNFHSESCSAYFDPDLKSGFMGRVIDTTMGSSAQASQTGMSVLGAIAKMARQGPAPLMHRMNTIEAEKSAAKKDAVMLARMPRGCENPKFERLYKNLINYVKGRDPAFANGWPGLKLACIDHASSQGGGSSSRAICNCMVKQIKAAKLPDHKAEWLRVNYDHGKNLASVIQGKKGLRKKLGACLLR